MAASARPRPRPIASEAIRSIALLAIALLAILVGLPAGLLAAAR